MKSEAETDTVTGEGTAPRRPKVYIPIITHDVLQRAVFEDARHCPGQVALEDFGKLHEMPWRNIVADKFDITLIDTERRVKLRWQPPRDLQAFMELYDEGKVIDLDGNINFVEEFRFRLDPGKAEVTALPEPKTLVPRKTRKPAGTEDAVSKIETLADRLDKEVSVFQAKIAGSQEAEPSSTPADSEQASPPESRPATPRKPREPSKARTPRARIAPSFHRVAGIRGFNQIAAKLLVTAGNAESTE
jgi:hypothetical protein